MICHRFCLQLLPMVFQILDLPNVATFQLVDFDLKLK
jgi:hypothetical protein